MSKRKDFLKKAWNEIINIPMQEHWIDDSIRESEKHPDEPFADVGPALKRLLALGASRKDLSIIARSASNDSAQQVLYLFGDRDIDGNDIAILQELLSSADPSIIERLNSRRSTPSLEETTIRPEQSYGV